MIKIGKFLPISFSIFNKKIKFTNKMNPIDFTQNTHVTLGHYRIDDPVADSIYGGRPESFHFHITNQFSRSILWDVNRDGYVRIDYRGKYGYIAEYYLSRQLPNLFALLGAIYTFYNQPLTEDLINRIALQDPIKIDEINEQIRREGATTMRDLIRNIGTRIESMSSYDINDEYWLYKIDLE